MIRGQEPLVLPAIRLLKPPPSETPLRCHGVPPSLVEGLLSQRGIVVYLWLRNGQNFWFYLDHGSGGRLLGCIWTGREWRRQDVPCSFVKSYY